MGIFSDLAESITNFFKGLTTQYERSGRWKEWLLGRTINHCWFCISKEHKIFEVIDEKVYIPEGEEEPPVHERCACYFAWLRRTRVGVARI